MKVYSLIGIVDHEGDTLLAVCGSKEDLFKFIEQEKSKYRRRPDTLGYDRLGYVESELGQSIDFFVQLEWL